MASSENVEATAGGGASVSVYPGMELTSQLRRAVAVTEMFAPSAAGPVRVLVYRPRRSAGPLPLVLRMHGGSFSRFRADSFPASDAAIAGLGATVVSVDYRLAPAHRFPAAPEDCYAALCWAFEDLEIDRSRIVVAGSSAGGALAVSVSLMARDRSGPPITHQLLHVPVLDDRLSTPSMCQVRPNADGLTKQSAVQLWEPMWENYLPPDTDRTRTSPYAAPARAVDLAGLPATFLHVNERDPLRDEGVLFAQRLLHAGVPVELYCAPGLGHEAFPGDSPVAGMAQRLFDMAMMRALDSEPVPTR